MHLPLVASWEFRPLHKSGAPFEAWRIPGWTTADERRTGIAPLCAVVIPRSSCWIGESWHRGVQTGRVADPCSPCCCLWHSPSRSLPRLAACTTRALYISDHAGSAGGSESSCTRLCPSWQSLRCGEIASALSTRPFLHSGGSGIRPTTPSCGGFPNRGRHVKPKPLALRCG